MYIFLSTISIVIGLFGTFHWTIALVGRTTIELCEISDGYKPIRSISLNFLIIFGTCNPILAFLPYYIPLSYYGCEWNKNGYNKVQSSEAEEGNIISNTMTVVST